MRLSLVAATFLLLVPWLPAQQAERPVPGHIKVLPCSPEEDEVSASVEIIFPANGQMLDQRTDLSIGRNLLVRLRLHGFRLRIDGEVLAVVVYYGESNTTGSSDGYKSVARVAEPNFELFGLMPGYYSIMVMLVDLQGFTRNCWLGHPITFTVGYPKFVNRSVALLQGLDNIHQSGGRIGEPMDVPWLMQPFDHGDFAYVTALWGDDYVDTVLAWAAGLQAVGSTFRRVCMVLPELVSRSHLVLLEHCCCEVLPVEPISPPRLADAGGRYSLVLTKFRVFQLGRYGLRKIVFMDSDILVLQNVDELFWLPAPAAAVLGATLLGQTVRPRLSAGVMVLEPSDEEFDALMRSHEEWAAEAPPEEVPLFMEQDVLDRYWRTADRRGVRYHVLPMTYNVYPELLDTLPFLAPVADVRGADASEGGTADALGAGAGAVPMDHGVKLVHLWHWYNPVQAMLDHAKNVLQVHAKTKHPQMWRWYTLWWQLHQKGLAAAEPEMHKVWLQNCRNTVSQRYQKEGIVNSFVPTMLGVCFHVHGGLDW